MTQTQELCEDGFRNPVRFAVAQRFLLSPTVVSLYSELPPSMMISPASSRGTWTTTRATQTDQLSRQGSSQVILMKWTHDPPIYQWSRPQPVQLWPAGWSSWVSSAWTPCPPGTLLRSLWNPLPHSSGSHAPLTRFDCRHRPVEGKDCWLHRRAAGLLGGEWRPWPYHEAVVIHVHDEVLAHDSQANQCNVCSEEATGVITFNIPVNICLQPEPDVVKSPLSSIFSIGDILALWTFFHWKSIFKVTKHTVQNSEAAAYLLKS